MSFIGQETIDQLKLKLVVRFKKVPRSFLEDKLAGVYHKTMGGTDKPVGLMTDLINWIFKNFLSLGGIPLYRD